MRRSMMRRLYEKADILIADLPCSGLGILGKETRLEDVR